MLNPLDIQYESIQMSLSTDLNIHILHKKKIKEIEKHYENTLIPYHVCLLIFTDRIAQNSQLLNYIT